MNELQSHFLSVVTAALRNTVPPAINQKSNDWEGLFHLASEQEVLPLVFDTCCNCGLNRSIDRELYTKWQKRALYTATRQIIQNNEFLTLVLSAQEQGLDPIVLKGIICRSAYPKPMLRPSVDEDLLISPQDTEQWHQFLLSEGLSADEPEADRKMVDELSYHKHNSPTYLELHRSLFSRTSESYGDLNDLFTGAPDRTVEVQIEDVTLRTLAPTDHFLYLICHAYKHFLHAGVGIRQAADMALFANRYGDEIDWESIYDSCSSVHIDTFAAALLKIAHKHLTLKEIPAPFSEVPVDEEPLLEDILAGGLYGTADINRAHSSNMTLDAVAARNQKRKHRGIWHSLFPGKEYLQSHFAYAKRHPILLPAAWGQRIIQYLKKSRLDSGNPVQSIQIGQKRIELLKKYKII